MRSVLIQFAPVALLLLTPTAYALTGENDGIYTMDYQSIEFQIQCNDTQARTSVTLEGEELPEDAFAAIESALVAGVEAAGLRQAAEAAALISVEALILGLEESVALLLLSYPETMSIQAVAGSKSNYLFESVMTDLDLTLDDTPASVTALGTMTSGTFALVPLEVELQAEQLGYLAEYISVVGGQFSLTGAVNQGAGTGMLTWGLHITTTGSAGYPFRCQVKSSTSIVMAE